LHALAGNGAKGLGLEVDICMLHRTFEGIRAQSHRVPAGPDGSSMHVARDPPAGA
jgi:hypothetical protein